MHSLIDSKQLFQNLLQLFTVEETRDEKEAILLLLLEHELRLSRMEVMMGKKAEADEVALRQIVERLNKHEPIQYILGEAEFYGRTFAVSPAVLIPRQETEILVQTVVERFRGMEHALRILDIGTGSGCMGITLALELPYASILATDISEASLSIARTNAARLSAKVQFERHDILTQPLTGPLDIIISNPPYILEKERSLMKPNVKDFEPSAALFVPDADPLVFCHAIVEQSKLALSKNGFLMMEINETLGATVERLFQAHGFAGVQILKDLNSKERFVAGIRN